VSSKLGPRRGPPDDGSLAIYVLLSVPIFVLLLGLLLEGGVALNARGAADAAAESAARAGASTLYRGELEQGRSVIDAALAIDAAEQSLAGSGYRGTATVLGSTVTVMVTPMSISTPMLELAGISHLTVFASASATPVVG
jgi:Flp pilus assembly protein TadG